MPYSDPKAQKLCMERYLKTPEGKASVKRGYTKYNRTLAHTLSNKRWRERNKEKAKAHGMLAYAIKLGRIIKPKNCEHCGEEKKLHGHHHDYSKPLDVIWLCVPCHKEEHAQVSN